MRLLWRIKREGYENVPRDGALMMCANHNSNLDPIFIAVTMAEFADLRFMAKKELFAFKPLAALLNWIGAFPVDRQSADIKSAKTTMTILKEGGRLLVFPEGTRYLDGEIRAAKPGVGLFALRLGVTVLPVYITNKKRLFGKVRVIFGKPMVFNPPAGAKAGAELYQQCADEIMDAIRALKNKTGL